MLPETFPADKCFLDVSQFCHTENIVSVSKNVSAVKQIHILLLETVFPVWHNWETSRKHASAANVSGNRDVSSFCQGFILDTQVDFRRLLQTHSPHAIRGVRSETFQTLAISMKIKLTSMERQTRVGPFKKVFKQHVSFFLLFYEHQSATW